MTEREIEERRITWKVVGSEQFRLLLANTIGETVLQNVAAACSSGSLLRIMSAQAVDQGEIIGLVEATTQTAVAQLRAIQALLRQAPDMPIPIDHRYEKSGEVLMIALDATLKGK